MQFVPKKLLPLLLALLLVVASAAGCAQDANSDKSSQTPTPTSTSTPTPTPSLDYPREVEQLGSGTVKWKETDTADGWTMVTNEGGATLGYTKNTKVKLIQADGYAFKDLNKNGKLDQYEDWRVDFEARAKSLAEVMTTEQMMGLKMNPFSIGKVNADALDDSSKLALDLGHRDIRAPGGGTPEVTVAWNNMIQAYIENLDIPSLPATFIADPLGGKGVSKWPGYLGVAATFDPAVAAQYGQLLSKEWRALGITMKVAPQMDLATEPRWKRDDMTFGEDPALSVDMARAIVNAFQSTYAADGTDLGWGVDSVNCQIKHFPSDGAAEGGRESHTYDGAYNVFPGGQFGTHLLPFLACLELPGKTKSASSLMTNFSVAIGADGKPIGGERVATSFNSWKINTLLRGQYGFDGYILTDFGIINDGGKTFGVEKLTPAERELKIMLAGCDAFGGEGGQGQANIDLAMEAYNLGVKQLGKEEMDKVMVDSTRRTLKTFFNVGIVDNPYLSTEMAKTVPNNAENKAAGFAAQVKSIVMLKNSGNIIQKAAAEKPTVYIPWKFTPETQGRNGVVPASWSPVIDLKVAGEYFNVVTDKVADKLTGKKDDKGNPTASDKDIIRAPKAEIAKCNFALVRIKSPQNGNPTKSADTKDYEYLPISLQYRPYTANSEYVRLESIAGDVIEKTEEGPYGKQTTVVQENRSYFGKTGKITNESDLDLVLYCASVADKVIVAADVKSTMIFSEFEKEVDAIVIGFAGDRAPLLDDAAFLEVVSGKAEPSGLLPLQMPKNMETVEAQFEDVPRDMECYVDSEGNTYDFAYGLNWSGVIKDARVAKYNVPPIVGPSIK